MGFWAAVPAIISAAGAFGLFGDNSKQQQRLPSLSHIKFPGQEDFFKNIAAAREIVNPIQSAAMANAGRAAEAQAATTRRAIAGTLGPGVGTAAAGRLDEQAMAGLGDLNEKLAGALAPIQAQMGQQATEAERQKALGEIQKILGPFQIDPRFFETADVAGSKLQSLSALFGNEDIQKLLDNLFGFLRNPGSIGGIG